jgi:hypothetical protein
VALACLGLLARELRRRGLGWREAAPWLALAAALVPGWVDHSRSLDADGVRYFSYLRSLLFDLDLDLGNDFALLGLPAGGLNVLPVGVALLWIPWALPVRLALGAAAALGLASPPRGDEPVLIAAVCQASYAYGAAGLFLLLRVLMRLVPPAAAFWTTILCWVGTPLRFYLSTLPSFAHAAEFFAATLALAGFLALRRRPGVAAAAWAGAAAGLAFLVRSQAGLLLLPPGLFLLWRFATGPERRDALKAGLACGAGFLAAALPQLLVWQAMFGRPFLVPHEEMHGSGFVLADPEYLGVLFAPEAGLLTSHPALLAALLGLLVFARRDPGYLALALPALVAGWAVNASVFNWYQIRRFTGLVPLLAPGLARAVVPLTRAGVVPMLALAVLAYRYDLAVDTLRAHQGDPAPVRAVLQELGDGLAADGYALLEPRVPRAAAWFLDSWANVGVLEGPVTTLELSRERARLRLPEPARHLSPPELEDGAPARWVTDSEARLFLVSAWRGPVTVALTARALETLHPQSVELLWNGASLGRLATEPRWKDYRFDVPAERVRHGTNVLVVRFERAPIYRRMRGEGPRQVRPAALGRLRLWRHD